MNANDGLSAFYAAYDMQGDSADIPAVHPCILSEKLTYRPAQTRAGFLLPVFTKSSLLFVPFLFFYPIPL